MKKYQTFMIKYGIFWMLFLGLIFIFSPILWATPSDAQSHDRTTDHFSDQPFGQDKDSNFFDWVKKREKPADSTKPSHRPPQEVKVEARIVEVSSAPERNLGEPIKIKEEDQNKPPDFVEDWEQLPGGDAPPTPPPPKGLDPFGDSEVMEEKQTETLRDWIRSFELQAKTARQKAKDKRREAEEQRQKVEEARKSADKLKNAANKHPQPTFWEYTWDHVRGVNTDTPALDDVNRAAADRYSDAGSYEEKAQQLEAEAQGFDRKAEEADRNAAEYQQEIERRGQR